MIVQLYDYALLAWFVIAGFSTAYVAYDQFANNPEPTVMKWGFILITLYMGPFELVLYVLADKEPRPGEHEKFISPLWKSAISGRCDGSRPAVAMARLGGNLRTRRNRSSCRRFASLDQPKTRSGRVY
jgi:hypothetical protein